MNTQTLITSIWPRAKKMAFWDQGQLEFENWRTDFKNKKSNVIEASVNFMRASDLINLIGQKDFIKSWPSINQHNQLNPIKRAILDGAWGMNTIGDPTVKIDPILSRFHTKKRYTLKTIAESEGNESIYAIAKRMGRNYRRVFDDIKDFESKNLIELIEKKRKGRRYLIARLLTRSS